MVNIAIVGPGLVGKELLQQLIAHQASPRAQVQPLAVVGIINSKNMLLGGKSPSSAPAPLGSLATWSQQLPTAETANLDQFIDRLATAGAEPTVVVDCTSNLAVAEQYPAWLKRGLHIVTPNKKGYSSQWSLFEAIRSNSRPQLPAPAPWAFHEATVGAGLPVLSTLSDLVKTGDEIVKVEGIFSGTLSYLFNNYSAPGPASAKPQQAFSDIVSVAKSLGYTEPDPRDDLNGMDVARKVVILARVAGLKLSIEDLDVENIVPEALRGVASADEFMAQLPQYDDHFAALNQQAAQEGTVLRYVGVVDPKGKSSVKLMKYPVDHPFAGLKGSDNIIAFTTKYFPSPLIVQGAGAGAAVTAFGIFADILKVAERVA
ncbi:Homoserine dehydrogenase [Dimargaris cristalligena]|uniref:Homoserine dehydrogenase n=1 Tax=Dimargaris cristalligena TaxID=215637 RepID=A0A4P9ZT35_9FUNG|nr:Homoserine dehydrogenase [Dimargaris cristalligena]RKP35670.1 homoserine dehydrogenase-domain-containing protein [Dimargaris cristalligena]|eukprot:RKP35670.1 homoserine dehydrogenase-domain-containing protein [Dimargaris cristalligena]